MGLLGILTAAAFLFWHLYSSQQCFLPGVAIATTDMQGYSLEEAGAALQESLDKAYLYPVVFSQGEYRQETTLGGLTFPVDVAQVLKEILEQEQQRGFISKAASLIGQSQIAYELPIEYRADVVQGLLKEWQEALGVPAVDARLKIDRKQGLLVIPEKHGKEIDYNATWAQMATSWDQAVGQNVEIVMQTTSPAVVEKDLAGMGELSSYTTWYQVAEVDRTHNLSKAAHIINGVMLGPGQVFSFNKTVGPRTGIAGYRDALIIVGDKFEPGTGGGICQVSSTLYNASLLAGLETVERYNHGLAIAYIPLGLDATVAYGLQDYRFRNNTNSPIYIRADASGGKLTIGIYGNLADKKRIKLTYVIDEVIPFQEVHEIDPEMAPGEIQVEHEGIPGYVVRSFRSYLDANGEIITSEQLAKDRYRPLNQLILQGGELPPEPAGTDPVVETGDENSNKGEVDHDDSAAPPVIPPDPWPPEPADPFVETGEPVEAEASASPPETTFPGIDEPLEPTENAASQV